MSGRRSTLGWIAGFGIGMFCGIGLAWSLRTGTDKNDTYDGPPSKEREQDLPRESVAARTEETASSQGPKPDVRKPLHEQPATTPGRVRLRIGDAFVFGSGVTSRDNAHADRGDIYCQDIRHGASLRCPFGAAPAIAPISSAGLPETASSASLLIADAPLLLPKRDLMLTTKPRLQLVGIGFVQARSGAVYKLFLEKEEGHPDALCRSALIAFEKVRQTEQGGELRLPQVHGQLVPEVETTRLLLRSAALGKSIGSSFSRYLEGGDFGTVGGIDTDLSIDDKRLVVKKSVATKLEARSSSLVLEGDLSIGGEVVLHGSTGVAIGGDARGTIRVQGYSHIHVKGQLTGTLEHNSYASTFIEGDVLGVIKLRSYSDILIRGRMLGKLDVDGSCWSTLYLESFISQTEIAALKGSNCVTLHVKSSDLATGEHENIGAWRTVIVGDPLWQTMPK